MCESTTQPLVAAAGSVCRLCLGSSDGARSRGLRFEPLSGVQHIIQRWTTIQLKISDTDLLPKKVCQGCVTKLKDINTFCQKAVSVQEQLLNWDGSHSDFPAETDIFNSKQVHIIKKEFNEDSLEQGVTSNGVIVFRKPIEIFQKKNNYNSKYTQTELKCEDLEGIVKKNTEDFNLDAYNLEEIDSFKVKIEEIDEKSVLDECEINYSYSSDDDLTLSRILCKDNDNKSNNLDSISNSNSKKKTKLNNVVKKRTIRRRKTVFVTKNDYVNEESISENDDDDSGSIIVNKKCKKDKTKSEKIVKDKCLDDGDKNFYPEGTAEELKKWQCLTCFVIVKSRNDLLQHYKEHLENPSKFLAKLAVKDSEDVLLSPASVEPSVPATDGARNPDGTTRSTAKKRETKSGVDYAEIDSPDFGDSLAFQCTKCLKMFLNRKAIIRHLGSHDDVRPFPCNMCGRAYKRAYEILLHGRVHNGFKTLVCKYPACSFKTVYRGALRNHIKRHEAAGSFKYNCEVCNKGFDVITWFNEHKNVHLGVRPFTCDLCGKGFTYSRYLTSHRKWVHPESEEKTGKQLLHRCPSCPSQFPYWKSLKAHMKREHETQRLPGELTGSAVLCDICGKGLSTKEHLKFHRRIHTGEKPFICRTCGKGFVKKCNLTLHERVHSGEKPHVCQLCGKAFSQRSTLVIHERYHSGARPYVCNICHKGFVAKGLLSMHQKTCI